MKSASNSMFLLICTIYLGANAVIYFLQNQTVTGDMSDVYLLGTILTGLLAAVSAMYMLLEDVGKDSSSADVTIPMIQLTVPKWFFYLGLYIAVGVRLVFAYRSNHNATGVESVWGFVWIIASIIIALGTWPNAIAYFKNKARISAQKKQDAEDEAAEAAAARKAAREARTAK